MTLLSCTLGELFEAILPGIDRTITLLETAQRLQDEAKTSFLESMNKYENDLSLTINNHMDVVDGEGTAIQIADRIKNKTLRQAS